MFLWSHTYRIGHFPIVLNLQCNVVGRSPPCVNTLSQGTSNYTYLYNSSSLFSVRESPAVKPDENKFKEPLIPARFSARFLLAFSRENRQNYRFFSAAPSMSSKERFGLNTKRYPLASKRFRRRDWAVCIRD